MVGEKRGRERGGGGKKNSASDSSPILIHRTVSGIMVAEDTARKFTLMQEVMDIEEGGRGRRRGEKGKNARRIPLRHVLLYSLHTVLEFSLQARCNHDHYKVEKMK